MHPGHGYGWQAKAGDFCGTLGHGHAALVSRHLPEGGRKDLGTLGGSKWTSLWLVDHLDDKKKAGILLVLYSQNLRERRTYSYFMIDSVL